MSKCPKCQERFCFVSYLACSMRAREAAVSENKLPVLLKNLSYFSQSGPGYTRRKLPMCLFSHFSMCFSHSCNTSSSSSLQQQQNTYNCKEKKNTHIHITILNALTWSLSCLA